jgi:hypothetical protein
MFTPRHIRSIEGRVRTAAKEIVDRVAPKGDIDFVTEVAADLPLIVIAELIGVPQEDRHKVFEWSNRMVGAEDPEYGADSDPQVTAAELYAYAQSLADERLADPGEDTLHLLLTGEVDGEARRPEFNVFFLLLAVAGNGATQPDPGGTLASRARDQRAVPEPARRAGALGRDAPLRQPCQLLPPPRRMIRDRGVSIRRRQITAGTRLRPRPGSRTRTFDIDRAERASPSVGAARTSASAPTSPATRSTACSRSCAGSCPTWSSPAPSSGCT